MQDLAGMTDPDTDSKEEGFVGQPICRRSKIYTKICRKKCPERMNLHFLELSRTGEDLLLESPEKAVKTALPFRVTAINL